MLDTFTVKQTPRLRFGPGTVATLPDLARTIGTNLLIVTGKQSFITTSTWKKLSSALKSGGLFIEQVTIENEPSPEDINVIVNNYRQKKIDVVIAIGGGSVMDSGKAISAMLQELHPIETFLEGIGTKVPSGKKTPCIAVPTTSGTGSEATSNAVISRTGVNGFKKSLRHDNYVPDIAIVDPELTISCPIPLTVTCGMDCYTQLVEAFLSTNSNLYTDNLALHGIGLVARALKKLISDPENIEARSAMSYGTYLSGIVLANAGLGTIHGFASAIGGHFKIPHGVVCGALMAETNRATLQKLRNEDGDGTALDKYSQLGRTVCSQPELTNEQYQDAFIASLFGLTRRCRITRLGSYGISTDNLQSIAARTSNKYNPVQFSKEELYNILKRRL